MTTRRPLSATGSGRSSKVLTTLKTAVFTPTASAIVNAAAAVNPGAFRSTRIASTTSCRRLPSAIAYI
jgi:hypothetical protein